MAGLQANWDFLSDFQQRGTLALDALRAQAAQSPWGVASNGRILEEPRLRSMEEMYLPDQRLGDDRFGWPIPVMKRSTGEGAPFRPLVLRGVDIRLRLRDGTRPGQPLPSTVDRHRARELIREWIVYPSSTRMREPPRAGRAAR